MSDAPYRLLDWDSQWFGFPIGRADLPEITPTSALEVDAWARAGGLRCVYVFTRNSTPESPPAGFTFMDSRVEYELAPRDLAEGPIDPEASMQPGEEDAVHALARRLFTETRFSRDAGFPPDRVSELYAEWVRKDSTGCIPGCLVTRSGNTISGFVTGRTDPADASRGSIGLLGVAESRRGQGLGSRLLDQVCRVFVANGVKTISVVTQETNTAACRLYGHRGRVVARGYWYHRWY